jgi:hypothetical protein
LVKTLVYQSYRTGAVPAWIETCRHSVRAWASSSGADYRFIGDEIFDLVPAWFAGKAEGRKQIVTDLGRLVLARRFLGEGYERVVWLDADTLVFDPARFNLDPRGGYAFGSEVWIQRDGEGRLRAFTNVHNAITVFDAGNSFLDFYIDACLSIMERVDGGVPPQIIGPKFLKAIHTIIGFDLVPEVSSLSPLVLDGLQSGGGDNAALALFRRKSGANICAANLCGSLAGGTTDGVDVTEPLLDEVCAVLLNTRGRGLNAT